MAIQILTRIASLGAAVHYGERNSKDSARVLNECLQAAKHSARSADETARSADEIARSADEIARICKESIEANKRTHHLLNLDLEEIKKKS